MNKNPNQSGLKAPMTSDTQPAKRGRPAGVPNKNNLVRAWIEHNYTDGFDGYVQNLIDTIELIDKPTEKARLLLGLMEYIAPKLKHVDTTIGLDPESGKLTIVYQTANKPKPDVEV